MSDPIGSGLSLVALIGRPNVGKSTLFNRIADRRLAIVNDTPGVTRDRKYANTEWEGVKFRVVDTGGFEPVSKDEVLSAMRRQTEMAVAEADVVVMLTDGRDGVMPQDEEVLDILRRSEKPLLVAVNKVDGPKHEDGASEFYSLGVEQVWTISAAHGRGVGDLLSEIVELIGEEYGAVPEDDGAEEDDEGGWGDTGEGQDRPRGRRGPPHVSVIGRPNAGKSTLINKILGEERLLALPQPGTTRDSVNVEVSREGKDYVFVDTAGMRKQRRVKEQLEKLSVSHAIRALEAAEVSILMIDATEGVGEQDAKIAGLAHNRGRGVVIMINKWDQVKSNPKTARQYEEDTRYRLRYLSYAPMVFGSAMTGAGLKRLFTTLDRVVLQARRRVRTSQLNQVLERSVARHSPPTHKGRQVKFYYITQVRTGPPTFVVSTNRPEGVHFSYQRFLSNAIREEFGFEGVPLRFFFRRRGREPEQRR